jgi:uncharacterized RDD family membrane protein YckC
MSAQTIAIESVTGVDIELEVAGPGARSFAFKIDWSIRLLIALAWVMVGGMIAAALAAARGGSTEPRSILTWVVAVPASVLYFLYHPVLETVMRGRTPGKRIAGVRILTRQGEVPSAGAILVRNVFRLVDSLPAFYVVGLVTCLFTEQRVRIGDMAAGTVLIADRSESEHAFARLNNTVAKTGMPLETAELIQELLERWWDLDERRRADFATRLLAKAETSPPPSSDRKPTATELRTRLRRALEGISVAQGA